MTQNIPPKEIESTLSRIWSELQGAGKMRACLFNLIIYSKKTDRENYLKEISQKIIEKFPSRIIFVTIEEEASDDYLNTAVSVMTAEDFVCDLIEIRVGGHFVNRVPFVILPHILPDLPVYMLKGDDPTADDPVSINLERFSRRIIFDSETADDLPAYARAVLSHKESLNVDVADLNWARIEGWRRLLAGTFHTEDRLTILKSSSTIDIHYNSCESRYCAHTKTQAIFLSIWLKEQLGEEWKGQTNLLPSCLKEIPAGRILGLDVKTDRGETVTLKRKPTCPEHILIEMTTKEACEIPTEFILSKDVYGQSLIREIGHKGTSSHFLSVLNSLSGMQCEDLK